MLHKCKIERGFLYLFDMNVHGLLVRLVGHNAFDLCGIQLAQAIGLR